MLVMANFASKRAAFRDAFMTAGAVQQLVQVRRACGCVVEESAGGGAFDCVGCAMCSFQFVEHGDLSQQAADRAAWAACVLAGGHSPPIPAAVRPLIRGCECAACKLTRCSNIVFRRWWRLHQCSAGRSTSVRQSAKHRYARCWPWERQAGPARRCGFRSALGSITRCAGSTCFVHPTQLCPVHAGCGACWLGPATSGVAASAWATCKGGRGRLRS